MSFNGKLDTYIDKEGYRHGGKACDEPRHKDNCSGKLKKYRKLVTVNNKPYGLVKHRGVWVCDQCNKMFIGDPKGCRWIPRKDEIVRDRIMKKWENESLENHRFLAARLREKRDYYKNQIEWREKALSTGVYRKEKELKLKTEIDYIKSTILPDFDCYKEYINTRSW